jgi:hypothetical protein
MVYMPCIGDSPRQGNQPITVFSSKLDSSEAYTSREDYDLEFVVFVFRL